MREILFRGRDISGQWHYGVPLIFTEDFVCITAPHTFNKKVETETLGQYTGLTDKNGKKIFEGDLCEITLYDPFDEAAKHICRVDYCEGCFYYRGNEVYCQLYNLYDTIECTEVVGNIYDNPELMEV